MHSHRVTTSPPSHNHHFPTLTVTTLRSSHNLPLPLAFSPSPSLPLSLSPSHNHIATQSPSHNHIVTQSPSHNHTVTTSHTNLIPSSHFLVLLPHMHGMCYLCCLVLYGRQHVARLVVKSWRKRGREGEGEGESEGGSEVVSVGERE